MWMRLPTVVAVVLALSLSIVFAQSEKDEYDFPDYAGMRAHFGELYNEGKYEEGARLLEWAIPRFPDHLMANSYNLALIYRTLDRHEEAVDALLHALDRGVWFSVYAFEQELWDPLKRLDKYAEVQARNEELRRRAQKNARPELSVVTPAGYDDSRLYPLFIALHGGNENMADFKEVWKSPKLEREFVVAYVQSSQVTSMNGFGWEGDLGTARKEILDAYHKVREDYSIDEGEVIVGGFSSGGVASLDIAMRGTLPVAGFVVLCPGRVESVDKDNAAAARERGVRGALLTTEMDGRLSDQKEMVEVLDEAGVFHRFVITPDVGHWIPDDLGEQIDLSIDHIRGGGDGDRAVVERVIHDSIGWAIDKDRARLESILSHDDKFFIFHPDSKGTVRGWETFTPLFGLWMDERFKATRFDVSDLSINFSQSGTVAWFSAHLDDCWEWDGEPGCWEDVRWTGVLEEREGSWVIVQMHFSFASDRKSDEEEGDT